MMVALAYLEQRLHVDPHDLAVLASWLPVEEMTENELMIELVDILDERYCGRTVPEFWMSESSEEARAERRWAETQVHGYYLEQTR